ncbi:MAG: proline--tRNA ligase, partial [Bacteroidales bacterium]
NFAKAFDVKFLNKESVLDYVWATSWGVSTRLMGALVMTHSDDNGLVLPPKLAPTQVVFVPIYKSDEELSQIRAKVEVLRAELTKKGVTTHFDDRDNYKPGYKFAEYEMKGYPVRIAIGPKDLEKGTVEVARRDTLQKQSMPQENLADSIVKLLDEIQLNLFNKAVDFRTVNTTVVNNYDEFKKVIAEKGGFVLAHWDGTVETEQRIKEETKATIRCIPIDGDVEEGACILTGKPSKQRAIFAQAY